MTLDTLSGDFMCWGIELPRAGDEIYTHEFGDELNSLKYERDHMWISCINLNTVPFNLQQLDEQYPTDRQ